MVHGVEWIASALLIDYLASYFAKDLAHGDPLA
jgi:hypothetical protein